MYIYTVYIYTSGRGGRKEEVTVREVGREGGREGGREEVRE